VRDRTPLDPLLYAAWVQRRRARGLDLGTDHTAHAPLDDRSWFRRQVAGALLIGLTATLVFAVVPVSESGTAPRAVQVSPSAPVAAISDEPMHLPERRAQTYTGRHSGRDRRSDPAPQQAMEIIARYEAGGERWPAPSCVWVAPLLESHGLPPWMLAVAWRESRCVANAYNGDRSTGDDSRGLFQINALGPTLRTELHRTCAITAPEVLLDPHESVRCASALYAKYGYRPWHAGRYFE
jgi:hypothetical protein